MTLRRQVGTAIRWFPLLVLGMLLAGVPTYLYASRQPQVYEVSTTLLPEQLLPAANPNYNTVSLERMVGLSTNYAFIARSRGLLMQVATQLNLADAPYDLAKRVDARVDPNTAVLTITGRAGDAIAAAALANAVAHAIEVKSSPAPVNDEPLLADVAAVRQQMLETEAEYQRLLAIPAPRTSDQQMALSNSLVLLHELTTLYNSLTASLNTAPEGLGLVDSADPLHAQVVAPRPLYYALLAVVAGLLVAAGVASVFEYFDDRIKTPGQIAATIGLPTLGAIPGRRRLARGGEKFRLATLRDPRSHSAEAYRSLRARIQLASADAPIRTLLLTTSSPSEGKTLTAANLAVAFAQAGRRVVLVDADLRRPAVHALFRLPNTEGLTTLLRSEGVPVDDVAQAVEQNNLRILTSGPLPLDAAAVLGSDQMRNVLERLLVDSDLVVLDSAPLEAGVDAAFLGSYVDATLLVIDAARSRRPSVSSTVSSLADAHANVIGAVLFHAARGSLSDYHDDLGARYETAKVATPAVERADTH